MRGTIQHYFSITAIKKKGEKNIHDIGLKALNFKTNQYI